MSNPNPYGVPHPAPPSYPTGYRYPPGAPYPYGGYPAPGYVPAPTAGYPAPQRYPVAPADGVPRYHITLRRHTGLMMWWFNQTHTFTGTIEECEREYRSAQNHNLLVGWWSLASLLLWNWVSLLGNQHRMAYLRRLAAESAQSASTRP